MNKINFCVAQRHFFKMPKRARTGSNAGRKKPMYYKKPSLTVARLKTPTADTTIGGTRFRTKLKWNHKIALTSTTSPAYHEFRLNSLYDPDLTDAGNQPAGFDNLMAIYNKYHVQAVKWSLTACATGSTVQSNHYLVAYSATPARLSASTWPDAVAMLPYSRFRHLYIDGAGKGSMKMYLPLYKVLGVDRKEYLESDEYQGTVTTNPATSVYGYISTWNVDGTTSTVVYCYSKFTFYCEFRGAENFGFS